MPEIIVLEEFKEIEVPTSLLLSTGEVSAFPSILARNFFSIRYKKGKAVFQAGGYVGVIPINTQLSIDIRPKVPIANLERMVFLSNHKPQILKEFKRRYDPHEYSSASLSEFLIDCFLKSMEELCANGLLKSYKERSNAGLFPRGKIDFSKTIRTRSKTNDSSIASKWFDRTPDITPNQFLKSVMSLLLNNLELMKDINRKRSTLYTLNLMTNITDSSAHILLNHPMILDPENFIPSTKELYLDSISLAKIILQGKGLRYLPGNSTAASALVLDIAEAFEWYVLAILQNCQFNNNQLKILDGNIGGSDGGKRKLLESSANPHYSGTKIDATPDIVIERWLDGTKINIVIDVKYKSINERADRNDLNQIISYAAAYNSSVGLLIFPANEHNKSGIVSIGRISNMEFFHYFMDLGKADIESEENALIEAVATLIGYQPEASSTPDETAQTIAAPRNL